MRGVIVGESIGRGSVCSVDVGDARGSNVWPLENGDWAWNAWIAASLGLPRSGIEPNESDAERAAQQEEIERMLCEVRAAALTRRELPVRDGRGKLWAVDRGFPPVSDGWLLRAAQLGTMPADADPATAEPVAASA